MGGAAEDGRDGLGEVVGVDSVVGGAVERETDGLGVEGEHEEGSEFDTGGGGAPAEAGGAETDVVEAAWEENPGNEVEEVGNSAAQSGESMDSVLENWEEEEEKVWDEDWTDGLDHGEGRNGWGFSREKALWKWKEKIMSSNG